MPITVTAVESKPYTRRPAAPFTTSTLQQEAGRKLRFSARQTMSVAQSLYENGYITYMRTDSPSLSQQAIDAARAQARALYGAETVPDQPRLYSGKSKNAQEAHEAIRPSGDTFRTPSELASVLRGNDFKLYDLIWKRTVASQMADAKGSTASRDDRRRRPTADLRHGAEFTATGTVITFRGFLHAYEESQRRGAQRGRRAGRGQAAAADAGPAARARRGRGQGARDHPRRRATPRRASSRSSRSSASAARRPTRAIISTIIDRGYVTPRGQALVPNWIAFSVVRLLEEYFADLVEYDFTAEMEDDLDRIADGKQNRVEWLTGFYFGSEQHRGLRTVIDNLGEIDAREINSVRIADDITLRIGKYGPYLEAPAPEGRRRPASGQHPAGPRPGRAHRRRRPAN